MKNSLRLALVFLTASLAARLDAKERGFVDFGKIEPAKNGELVQVDLGSGMLKFASMLARCQDKEAASLIAGLTHVTVYVVGLDDTNRQVALERMTAVRANLARDGWQQIVGARGQAQDDVAIFVSQHAEDAIDGLVVTVMDGRKHEAVFVNVVGNITPGQLAVLGERLNIEPLRAMKRSERG